MCKTREVKKDDCYIIDINGRLIQGEKAKKRHWIDLDGKNHKPTQPKVDSYLGVCRQKPDFSPKIGRLLTD